jgi:acyl carrier protein
MLTRTQIRTAVDGEIRNLLLDEDEVEDLTGQEQLHELGLNSLMFARLVIQLEAVLGVDPFAQEGVVIWDARSVEDLVALYEHASASAAA